MPRNTATYGLALVLASFAFAPTSQAGQASGELGISLTIANACQVDSGFDPAAGRHRVQSRACARGGGYRVITEPSARDTPADANPSLRRDDAGDGRTLVTLYW